MTSAHTLKTRGLTLLKSRHPEIRKLRQANHLPSIHGHKVWDSSFVVMTHLQREPPPPDNRFMDLGCGWGALGIYAALRLGQKVTAIDADADVFPYLQLHARINGVAIETRKQRFERITGASLAGFHTIAGADICFWDSLVPVLSNFINRAIKAGVQRIIVADPGRPPFYQLAERCGQKHQTRLLERRTSQPHACEADLLIVSP